MSDWQQLVKRNMPLHQMYTVGYAYSVIMKKVFGINLAHHIFIGENGLETSYRSQTELLKLKKHFFSKCQKNKKYIALLCVQQNKLYKIYLKLLKQFKKINLGKIDNKKLLVWYKKFIKLEGEAFAILNYPFHISTSLSELNTGFSKDIAKLGKIRNAATKLIYYECYHQDYWGIFNVVAERFKIPKKLVSFLLPAELEITLKTGQCPVLNIELQNRYNYYVLDLKGDKLSLYTGSKAKELAKRALAGIADIQKQKINSKIKLLTGVCAYPGKFSGSAKIIFDEEDAKLKLKNGGVLITSMTRETLTPYLKKVGAIVTDEGGILCHAAIMSRELKIPCVIGAKIATQVFRDGDLVEVDAERGIVRKIL